MSYVSWLDWKKLSQVIAENLSEEEIKGLKAMFTNIDTDKSGSITYEELKTGLARLGSKLSEVEVKQLMEAVSCKSNKNDNPSWISLFFLSQQNSKLYIYAV